MKQKNNWTTRKYVVNRGQWRASRDIKAVAVGSRLVADITAAGYSVLLPQYARGRLLDLGCGTVPLYAMYQPYVQENTCVDWGGSFHNAQHLDYELDLNQPLPFANGEFDTIILSDVLEHIAEPMALWTEMARLLAPNGRIILNVPFFYCLHECPHDYYRYTVFALQRFAEKAGLTVIQLQATGGSVEVFADMMAKHFQFVPWVGKAMSIGVQWLAWQFGRTRIGQRVVAKTSAAFPFGYMMVVGK